MNALRALTPWVAAKEEDRCADKTALAAEQRRLRAVCDARATLARCSQA